MYSIRRRFTVLFLEGALLGALLPMSPAIAAPAVVSSDRSDNLVEFSYDSGSGEKASESTWTRRGGNSEVLFRVAVTETEDTGSGLLGKLSLRLQGDQAVKYDGWFVLHVEDDSGEVSYHRARPSELILRPRPGLRRVTVRFRFDVPSGTHTASGSFES